MKAIIGITPSQQEDFREYRLPKNYTDAVIAAGGLPLILPAVSEKSVILEYIDQIDGLLLSGGIDPDPLIYGENPLPGMGEIDPERDHFEIELITEALDRGLPVLGVCRGCQMLAVAAGGSLFQDLNDGSREKVYKHNQDAPGWYSTHYVRLEEGSVLKNLLGEERLRVNTVHHQAVKNPGSDFWISARAEDGVIEAIEKKDDTFTLGVQWHPEKMWRRDRRFLALFQELVRRAAE